MEFVPESHRGLYTKTTSQTERAERARARVRSRGREGMRDIFLNTIDLKAINNTASKK